MKKLIIGVCLLVLISSCGGGKKKIDPFEMLTEEIDSLAAVPDTVEVMEVVEEEPMVPATADESFADFIYNFDKAVDMEAEKDTTATSVKIEWIYLKTNKIKRYYFERLKGLWKLEAIDFADMPENEDSKESFYEFYEHFANDSLFQQTRLHNPLKFVTVDPDDEFQIIETTLEAEQWFAFQPVLPREFLTNVNYGQNENSKSNTKVIEIKGFGNGFNNTLYFERRNGLWKLVQFEDLSD